MDVNQQTLLKLLSAAIHGEKLNEDICRDADLKAVFEAAMGHQVHTLVFPMLKDLDVGTQKTLVDCWNRITLISAINQAHHYEKIKDILRIFNENGIRVVALKGLVNRNLYACPELRTMGDVDFLVGDKDIRASVELLKKMKYIELKRDSKHVHLADANGYDIELHRSLVNKRFVGEMPGFEDRIWKGVTGTTLDDVPVLTLSIQDQMVYLCIHLAGHFLQDGFGLRQLCDIVLFVEKYRDEIVWEQFYNDIREYGIYGFVRSVFLTCYKYLSMRLPEGIEYYRNLDEPYIGMLLDDILSGGTFGTGTLERIAANKRVNNYKRKERLYTFPYKIKSTLTLIFPSHKLLGDTYSYARRIPLLTPVAWIHRLLYDGFIKRKFTMREKVFMVFSGKSEELFRERIKLLHWMDL